MDPVALFRPGLLAGRAVAVAGDEPVAEALRALGAEVHPLDSTADEEAAGAAAAALPAVTGLVVRIAAPADERVAEALDGAWALVRAVATALWVPDGPPGRVVLVAPRAGEGPFAGAVRDAAENLARTLSIEWARYGVRPVAIAPGRATSDEQVAALVAFLASEAGDYYAGCRLDLA